uniref:Uncharacterized protein n=1 Tax=Octopus bimaculoides TaxID=37653 RepID=A0A0L8HWX5_OCTBM
MQHYFDSNLFILKREFLIVLKNLIRKKSGSNIFFNSFLLCVEGYIIIAAVCPVLKTATFEVCDLSKSKRP